MRSGVRQGAGDRRVIARFDDLLGRAVSMRALALLRVLAGPAVLLHLQPFLSHGWDGRTYQDGFYEPYAAWYPELPEAVYVGLLWLAAAAAVAMSLGFLTRVATATTFGIVAYNLFLSTTHFHNNRAYLVIVLGLLAVAPCGRELSLDASIRRRRGRAALDTSAPAWPLWLLRFECAAIYGASGLSKLVDPDWFRGTVTWQRVVRARDELKAWPLPDWAVSALTDRGFHTGAAKFIVLTELFIALGLWWRGTRYAAVWVAVVFHLSIETSASVQVFSYLGIAVLVIWAVPSTRISRSASIRPLVATGDGERWYAPRLAGALSRRASSNRLSDRGGGPGWHHDIWGAGRRADAEPPAADGVVLAPGAAPSWRQPGPPRWPRQDHRARRCGESDGRTIIAVPEPGTTFPSSQPPRAAAIRRLGGTIALSNSKVSPAPRR